jgi:initiation factor 1A|uniref:S1-like domain-containing protein n=1 Tax=viral metagenome TaxID=1070528 RepID=A0A6C0IVH4_9ZZZZ
MVKNTTGGTGAKGLARKHQQGTRDGKLITPSSDLEQVCCVTKMLGNGMCEVYTEDNTRLIAHIRNKFRGRQKRHNMISVTSIVMVGLREWENPVKNCDIMEIYSDSQIEQIKNIPSIKIDNVMKLRIGAHGVSTQQQDDGMDFMDESETAPEDNLPVNEFSETFTLDKVAEVDIDDI